jgi:hypothetical protein
MNDDPFVTLLTGTVAPIAEELWARLDVELADKDRQAIATALEKTALAAAKVAAAESAAQLTELESPGDAGLRFQLTEADTWAETYGASPRRDNEIN